MTSTLLQSLINKDFKHEQFETISQVTVTPELAKELLRYNTDNIPPQKSKISTYANQMRAGKWAINGDSLRFSKTGVLLDGQNRLIACIQAGVSFVTSIVVGLEPTVFNTIDQGRVRKQAHLLAREFSNDISVAEANLINSTISKVLIHDNGYSQGTHKKDLKSFDITPDDTGLYLLEHPELIEQARYIREVFGSRSILPQAVILFILHIGSRFNEEYTKAFLMKLVRGLNLADGETLFHMNQVLIQLKSRTTRWTPTERDNTLIKIWNSVGKKGLYSIVHRGNLKIRQADPKPFFQEPKPDAIAQMLEHV